MDCSLCKKPIKDYNSGFHRFRIDKSCSADICPDCVDKLFKWQGEKYARLFPTKAMKNRFKMS